MRHLPSVTALGWEQYLGQTETLTSMTLLGRYPIRVQLFWKPAVVAMEQALIDTGYENPCDFIGSYHKRPISGTNFWSWHSYGGAIDLDYGGDTDGDGDPTIDSNPHLHRPVRASDYGWTIQLTERDVDAILSIETGNGRPVWRWLGYSIGDTMHFEPACTPYDALTGITYQPRGDDMTYEQFRSAEFDLWTDENIILAYDAGMFEDPNRAGFIDYWVTHRSERTAPEKARFLTDYYAHLWKRS